jgi:hypothetical protein
MANVARPIIVMVTRKVRLRPVLSPKCPNTSAPKGRAKNPAAKVSSARMKPSVSPALAKKCLAMVEASEPNRKKSYHSKTVPAEEAAMTWVRPLRGGDAASVCAMLMRSSREAIQPRTPTL